MQDDITIRRALPDDFAGLSALLCECLEHYFGAPDGGEAAARRLLEGRSGSAECVIAYVGGMPAGFATFAVVYPGPQGRGTLYMKDLFVSSRARSRSLGTLLMHHLAGVACTRDCIRFDWTAESSNPRAIAFYQRLGAEQVTEKVYFRLSGTQLATFAAGRGED